MANGFLGAGNYLLQERDASGPKSNSDCEGVRDKQCILLGFLPQL